MLASVNSMKNRLVEKTILDNGLVIISETVEYVRSISLGIWVRAGSRHEQEQENGLSHFIEHAVFKGTKRRTAHQIAFEADVLGGSLDAFTTREYTGYYIRCLDSHLPKAFDILADIVTQPTFDPAELEKERDVILEEIKMVDDTPDELLGEIFTNAFWPNHSLGRPIEGTVDTVQSFTRPALLDYYQQIYQPQNMVIIVMGNIAHQQVVDLASQYFAHQQNLGQLPSETAPTAHSGVIIRKKSNLEQTHIILGTTCPSVLAPQRYVCSVLNTLLGGGLSSRLFQSVRERHGLAYSVYSSTDMFRDVGCLSICMAVAHKQTRKALNLTLVELKQLKDKPISEAELQATKDQLRTALLMSTDSISARMNLIAQNELVVGSNLSFEEIIAGIEQVTAAEIQQLSQEIFQTESLMLAILTNSNRLKIDRAQLSC